MSTSEIVLGFFLVIVAGVCNGSWNVSFSPKIGLAVGRSATRVDIEGGIGRRATKRASMFFRRRRSSILLSTLNRLRSSISRRRSSTTSSSAIDLDYHLSWVLFQTYAAIINIPICLYWGGGPERIRWIVSQSSSVDLFLVVLFSLLWGIGSVLFGVACKMAGVGLGTNLTMGVIVILGTLLPLLRNHQAATPAGGMILGGLFVCSVGLYCSMKSLQVRDADEERAKRRRRRQESKSSNHVDDEELESSIIQSDIEECSPNEEEEEEDSAVSMTSPDVSSHDEVDLEAQQEEYDVDDHWNQSDVDECDVSSELEYNSDWEEDGEEQSYDENNVENWNQTEKEVTDHADSDWEEQLEEQSYDDDNNSEHCSAEEDESLQHNGSDSEWEEQLEEQLEEQSYGGDSEDCNAEDYKILQDNGIDLEEQTVERSYHDEESDMDGSNQCLEQQSVVTMTSDGVSPQDYIIELEDETQELSDCDDSGVEDCNQIEEMESVYENEGDDAEYEDEEQSDDDMNDENEEWQVTDEQEIVQTTASFEDSDLDSSVFSKLFRAMSSAMSSDDSSSPSTLAKIGVCVAAGIFATQLQFAFVFGQPLIDLANSDDGPGSTPSSGSASVIWLFAVSIGAPVSIVYGLYSNPKDIPISTTLWKCPWYRHFLVLLTTSVPWLSHIHLYGLSSTTLLPSNIAASIAWPILMMTTVITGLLWSWNKFLLNEWEHASQLAQKWWRAGFAIVLIGVGLLMASVALT